MESKTEFEQFAEAVGNDIKGLKSLNVIINGASNWQTSSLKTGFKMVRVPHDFKKPVVIANNVTTGMIANPVFYIKEDDDSHISFHVTDNNHATYYANGKIEIHLSVAEVTL